MKNWKRFAVIFMGSALVFAASLQAAVKEAESIASVVNAPATGQSVFLRGKLSADEKTKGFFLKDETGEINVKISPDLLAPEATQANVTVEILGNVHAQGKDKTPQVTVGSLTVRETFVEEVTPEKSEK